MLEIAKENMIFIRIKISLQHKCKLNISAYLTCQKETKNVEYLSDEP